MERLFKRSGDNALAVVLRELAPLLNGNAVFRHPVGARDLHLVRRLLVRRRILHLELAPGNRTEHHFATAGEAHGNGFGISSKVHPKIADFGEEPRSGVAADPYSYPCQLEQQAGHDALAQWRNDTTVPLVTVPPTARHHTFDINLSLMGSDPFFPNGFDIDESLYLPPMGVSR